MRNFKKRDLALAFLLLMAFTMTSRVAFGYYGTTYPWTMYRYDLARTGTSISTAPNTNDTVWSSASIYNLGIPVVVNGMVIVTGGAGIYALDETTGVKLWGPISLTGSAYDPPAVVDGRIYFGTTNSGYFYCYNATDGTKIWEYDARPGQVQTSPAVSNGKVYFGTTDNYLYALNALTGAFVWRYTAGGPIYYSSPAIDGDLLYFGSDDDKVYALNITGSLPALKWFYPTFGNVRSTPCVADGKVFIGSSSTDHSLFALNKATGVLIWKYTLTQGYAIDTSPAFSDGIVFFTGSYNKAYALYSNATSGINYTETDPAIRLWSQTVGGSPSSPIVADGKLFFSCTDYKLYALDITTGLLIWTNTFTSSSTEPIVADGRIFVSNYYGAYCFGDYFPPVTYYYQVTPVPGRTFAVQLVVNGTPSSQLDASGLVTLKRMNYTVEGISGTTGMSNITIPNALLGGPYTVTVDGGLPQYSAAPVDNGTHTSLYFTYLHSVHDIEIIGTTVLPQLQPTISILSPEAKTYNTNNVPLTFTLDKSTSWIGYSLNSQANITIAGNITLTSLLDGTYNVVVYANDTAGNMGASSTVDFAVDTLPPNITDVVQIPIANNVQPTDTVNINATVTDNLSGVIQVSLNYTNGNGTWIIVSMTNLGGSTYNAFIPAFSAGTNVAYEIIAVDNASNSVTTVQLGYTYQYTVIPEFSISLILPILIIASLMATIFYRRAKHKSPNIL